MKLKKSHREALISKLNEVNEEISLKESINQKWLRAEEKDKPSDDVVDWHDMEMFLLKNKKSLIEKSLVDNDIDF